MKVRNTEISLTVKMFVRNFSTGAKWLIGKVVRETGPVSYLIALNDGRLIRRHVDHIRKRLDLEIPEVSVDPKIPLVSNSDDVPTSLPTVNNPTDLTSRSITPNIEERSDDITEPISTAGGDGDASPQSTIPSRLRQSTRERDKPVRYGDDIYD